MSDRNNKPSNGAKKNLGGHQDGQGPAGQSSSEYDGESYNPYTHRRDRAWRSDPRSDTAAGAVFVPMEPEGAQAVTDIALDRHVFRYPSPDKHFTTPPPMPGYAVVEQPASILTPVIIEARTNPNDPVKILHQTAASVIVPGRRMHQLPDYSTPVKQDEIVNECDECHDLVDMLDRVIKLAQECKTAVQSNPCFYPKMAHQICWDMVRRSENQLASIKYNVASLYNAYQQQAAAREDSNVDRKETPNEASSSDPRPSTSSRSEKPPPPQEPTEETTLPTRSVPQEQVPTEGSSRPQGEQGKSYSRVVGNEKVHDGTRAKDSQQSLLTGHSAAGSTSSIQTTKKVEVKTVQQVRGSEGTRSMDSERLLVPDTDRASSSTKNVRTGGPSLTEAPKQQPLHAAARTVQSAQLPNPKTTAQPQEVTLPKTSAASANVERASTSAVRAKEDQQGAQEEGKAPSKIVAQDNTAREVNAPAVGVIGAQPLHVSAGTVKPAELPKTDAEGFQLPKPKKTAQPQEVTLPTMSAASTNVERASTSAVRITEDQQGAQEEGETSSKIVAQDNTAHEVNAPAVGANPKSAKKTGKTPKKTPKKVKKDEGGDEVFWDCDDRVRVKRRMNYAAKVNEYKKKLHEGRHALRIQQDKLSKSDPITYLQKAKSLCPFDEEILSAAMKITDQAKLKEQLLEAIEERREHYEGDNQYNQDMNDFWTVLRGALDEPLIEDLLYLFRICQMFKLPQQECDRYDRLYKELVIAKNERVRLEMRVRELRITEELIKTNVFRAAIERRERWNNKPSSLSEEEKAKYDTEHNTLCDLEKKLINVERIVEHSDLISSHELLKCARTILKSQKTQLNKQYVTVINNLLYLPCHALAVDIGNMFALAKDDNVLAGRTRSGTDTTVIEGTTERDNRFLALLVTYFEDVLGCEFKK